MKPRENPREMSDEEFAAWLARVIGRFRGRPLTEEQRDQLREVVQEEREEIERTALAAYLRGGRR